MGTHKKSRKARNRSRSRSRGSDYSEGHKGSKSKRSRRRKSSSRSSSSGSRGGERYRSPSKSPERRRKKRSKKSRSRSREHYSKERRGTRRSRSRSASGSRSRQRSLSSSRSKKRRRSRSRSHSSDRLSKLGSRSKETSKTASPLPFKDVKESPSTAEDRPLESLQEKMQRALEAAATADAQLREQGILKSAAKNEILTYKEERKRQKKLAAIENDSFHVQPFQSSAQARNTVQAQQPVLSRDWTHDSAIFSSNSISVLQNATRYLDSVQPKSNGKLASDFLSVSREEKEERWFLKLQALRKQRLEGKPLPGRRQKDDRGRNGR